MKLPYLLEKNLKISWQMITKIIIFFLACNHSAMNFPHQTQSTLVYRAFIASILWPFLKKLGNEEKKQLFYHRKNRSLWLSVQQKLHQLIPVYTDVIINLSCKNTLALVIFWLTGTTARVKEDTSLDLHDFFLFKADFITTTVSSFSEDGWSFHHSLQLAKNCSHITHRISYLMQYDTTISSLPLFELPSKPLSECVGFFGFFFGGEGGAGCKIMQFIEFSFTGWKWHNHMTSDWKSYQIWMILFSE